MNHEIGQEIKSNTEKATELQAIAKESNNIHSEQRALNAAQETKIDLLTDLMIQQRGGPSIGDRSDDRFVILAQRIADVNTENARLRREREDLLEQLAKCRGN